LTGVPTPLLDLIISGSPYALLVAAVWWMSTKLKQTEQRLHDRDEKRSLEVEQYIKIVERLAQTLAENNLLLKQTHNVLTDGNRLIERAEIVLKNTMQRSADARDMDKS
jgi:hypothetical protein